jgi:hypothetical protein
VLSGTTKSVELLENTTILPSCDNAPVNDWPFAQPPDGGFEMIAVWQVCALPVTPAINKHAANFVGRFAHAKARAHTLVR